MPKNLTQFKKLPIGTIMTLVEVKEKDIITNKHPKLNVPRKIAKMQTNAIMFEDKSWLYFPSAKNVTFNNDLVTFNDFVTLRYKINL